MREKCYDKRKKLEVIVNSNYVRKAFNSRKICEREGNGDVYEEASNCVLKSASCWSANGGVAVGFVVGEITERWKGARPKKDEALCRAAGQETLLIAETEGILICKG
ncbi:hypothetical protein LSTR_LSTR015081 [Laodelphax striatellus]|uniref:Uncharacterized protein n=1 Tax=Laodelphax striatellus TaxID=195883 RepID=A0A482WPS3_LAOST|nr:hypothetical protein LSTR_LSTR015081 [Laodelphax striatellus]